MRDQTVHRQYTGRLPSHSGPVALKKITNSFHNILKNVNRLMFTLILPG